MLRPQDTPPGDRIDAAKELAELRRLWLAESDMRQAVMAAEAWAGEVGDLARVLETALAVCYWRPFGKNGIGRLSKTWAPTDPAHREIHELLRLLRNEVYAHSDWSSARGIEDLGALYGRELAGRYVEGWRPLKEEFVLKAQVLATKQGARFKTAAHKIEANLIEVFELADDSEDAQE
jgi:hypothetical protein